MMFFMLNSLVFAGIVKTECNEKYGVEYCKTGNEHFKISFEKNKMIALFTMYSLLDNEDIKQIDSLIANIQFKQFRTSIYLKLDSSSVTDFEDFESSIESTIEYLNSFIQIKQIIVDCPSNFKVPNCLFVPKELNHIWLNAKSKLDFGNITYKSNSLQKLSIDANDELTIKNIDKLSIYNYIDILEFRAYIKNLNEVINNLCKLPCIGHLSLDLNFVLDNKKHYIPIPDNAFMMNTKSIFYDWVDLNTISKKTQFADSIKTVFLGSYKNLKIPFWWYISEWRNPPIQFFPNLDLIQFVVKSREIKAKFRKKYFGYDIIETNLDEDTDDNDY